MDLNYLTNTVLPQREKEIQQGKNAATRQPIYVVLSLQENCVSGHTDFGLSTNYKGVEQELGFVDMALDAEEREFRKTEGKMGQPTEVTRFWTDRIIAFFLTRKEAHEYLKYQAHNLCNPYVYVFYSGYANREMDLLLCNH